MHGLAASCGRRVARLLPASLLPNPAATAAVSARHRCLASLDSASSPPAKQTLEGKVVVADTLFSKDYLFFVTLPSGHTCGVRTT